MKTFTFTCKQTVYKRGHQRRKNPYMMLIIFSMVALITSSVYAQTDLQKYEQPVLEAGPEGSWDYPYMWAPSILRVGDIYHMWYTGSATEAGLDAAIGHATSVDGLIWTKDTLNPVLTSGLVGSWEQYGVIYPNVLFVDSVFHMWYTGHETTANNSGYRIGHATSSDGRIWTKDTLNPVINLGSAGSWDDSWILSAGSVIRVNNTYHIWYNAWDGVIGGNDVRIGHATSEDGRNWTKDPDPVLSRGSNADWDYPRVDGGEVVYDGNTFHMYYLGGNWFDWQMGYATSKDGSNLDKHGENPILERGNKGSWDELSLSHCSVVIDTVNDLYKMWYTGIDATGIDKIGYAESPATSIDLQNNVNIPKGVQLYQNYPNPFNPVTMINYQLPMASKVELSIYNLLGQEVATLVNERQQAGYHIVEWDASGIASGVYYYRLEAGNFIETRKMIYLK